MAFAYVYGLCTRSGLFIQNSSFAHTAAFLQGLCDSFDIAMTVVLDVVWLVRRWDDRLDGCYPICPTKRWPSWWMLSDSSNVAMTVMMDVVQFFRRSDDRRDGCYPICLTQRWPLGWMLSDSSNVAMTVVVVWPSWLVASVDTSERCNLLGSFLWRYDVPIGPSLLFGLQGYDEIFFWRTFAIERPILTLDHLFDDEQYLTRWSNVTVHCALVRFIFKVSTMVLRVVCM